jgi:membrane-bound lytic murein transglycosylase D
MTRPRRPHRCATALALALWLGGCATAPEVPTAPVAAVAPVVDAVPAPAAAASAPALPVASAVALVIAQTEMRAEAGPAAEAPIDDLRPETRVDLDDRSARIDLWARVRGGFAMPELDGALVRKWERYYAERPDYVQRMTERGGRYLFHIMEEVERRGLPTELALLPFIESAFNPEAMSHARASGMWQFMPATGRHFDLTQNVFRDDRRSVLDSTRAALDYLTRLHGMFDDWHLALAAYNWGEGSVQRAVRANQRARRGTDYPSLRMPLETRDYVPKLQAVKNIVADPAKFGLTLPTLENHPYFLAVPIARDIDVELAARLAELPLDEFRSLNPQMNKPVIVAAGTPQVLLPYDNANHFVKAVALHKGPLASWTAWVAPKTMKTADVAKLAGMSEEELRDVNDIPPRMLIKAGSTLLVPRTKHGLDDVSERLAANGMLSLASDGPTLRRVSHRVGRKGESVAGVARRFGVPAQSVAHWNNVRANSQFAAGTRVVVYVPQKAKARATKPLRAATKPARAAARKH